VVVVPLVASPLRAVLDTRSLAVYHLAMTVDSSPPSAGRVAVTRRGLIAIVSFLSVAAVLDIAYWVLWFFVRDQVATDTRPAYLEFEQAFPLADLWLLVCVVGAIVTLLRRRAAALFWLLAGGGAGIYLFAMDTLYDLQHGVWAKGANGLSELAIVLFTLTLSVVLLRWTWRRRRTVLDW
jgi:hypothetical protein